MLGSPLGDEPQRSRGKRARNHTESGDLDNGLEVAIAGVEVWSLVVAMVHGDDDTEEAAYLWHSCNSTASGRSVA